MAYPVWAPQTLVELHLLAQTPPSRVKELKYRLWMKLPRSEGTELLGKLINDQRMKSAWTAIEKRVKDNDDHLLFWRACQDGVHKWRSDLKLTKIQRKEFFIKIQKLASDLSDMMHQTNEFKGYRYEPLVKPSEIARFLKLLEGPEFKTEELGKRVHRIRLLLPLISPNVHAVLGDIGGKAGQFAQQRPLVLKPNSESAGLHYFVRLLSEYLRGKYGQPLHEVVAITAGVVFDKEDVDVGYIRSLLTST